MMPRYADVRRSLERYPDVTCAERHALWSWYRNARAAELITALNDPALEQSLVKLRRDRSIETWTILLSVAVICVAVAATLVSVPT